MYGEPVAVRPMGFATDTRNVKLFQGLAGGGADPADGESTWRLAAVLAATCLSWSGEDHSAQGRLPLRAGPQASSTRSKVSATGDRQQTLASRCHADDPACSGPR